MAEFPRGRFVWHELMTTDIPGARTFYTQVVGWKVQPMGEQYDVWMNGEAPVGGLLDLPQNARDMGAPPNWLGYVSSPDVDATVAEAQKRGATLFVGPTEVPDVGRWAILADPQRAVFAVHRAPAPSTAPLGTPNPGEFSWHELVTDDLDAAWEFYHALFGWERTGTFDMGEMGPYVMFGTEGQTFGGMFRRPAHIPVCYWLHYIKVPSAEEAVARVTAAGGKVLNGPMEVPGGDHVAQCDDPQGAGFAVHAAAQAPAQATSHA